MPTGQKLLKIFKVSKLTGGNVDSLLIYIWQKVKLRLNREETYSAEIEEESGQNVTCRPYCLIYIENT